MGGGLIKELCSGSPKGEACRRSCRKERFEESEKLDWLIK